MIVVAALIGFGWTKGTKTGDLKSALMFALLCGVLTALYTVVDAKGMRLSENRFSFIVWFFVVEGFGIALLMTVVNRAVLTKAVPIDIKKGIAAGALAVVSYGCALLAYSLAPIAHLAAVRETSVIFGALLAVFWLKEKMGTWRIGLAMVLAFGLVLMHIA